MLHDKRALTISIVDCVRKVRTYRMHAVQTIPQFQFLYMAIQRHIFSAEVRQIHKCYGKSESQLIYRLIFKLYC